MPSSSLSFRGAAPLTHAGTLLPEDKGRRGAPPILAPSGRLSSLRLDLHPTLALLLDGCALRRDRDGVARLPARQLVLEVPVPVVAALSAVDDHAHLRRARKLGDEARAGAVRDG